MVIAREIDVAPAQRDEVGEQSVGDLDAIATERVRRLASANGMVGERFDRGFKQRGCVIAQRGRALDLRAARTVPAAWAATPGAWSSRWRAETFFSKLKPPIAASRNEPRSQPTSR